MTELIRVSVGAEVQIDLELQEGLPVVEADVGQVQQVVMNLLTNAAEAIGERPGRISIRTSCVELGRDELQDHTGAAVPAGRYVRLEVADSGSGIAREHLHRIFDPFFTTKRTGRGLGLAAVLGIVRAHRGAVQVASEPSRGSTFRVLFPACPAPAVPAETTEPSLRRGGRGTVLVVDDEDFVRSLAQRMLEELGFEVLTASDGREGIRVCRAHREEISAVLLDLTMPGLDGSETLRELRLIRSDLPVLLCSGYGEGEVTERLASQTSTGFLSKPYSLEQLSQAMAKALVL
jgi:CheY-like chemotaxis protein